MKRPNLSRRLTKGTYRVVRVAVVLIGSLVLGIIFLCLFLRVYGMPEPLVRKVIHKANEAGLPVQTDGIFLTLKGWRLDHFEYYNSNPDELEPVLEPVLGQLALLSRLHRLVSRRLSLVLVGPELRLESRLLESPLWVGPRRAPRRTRWERQSPATGRCAA